MSSSTHAPRPKPDPDPERKPGEAVQGGERDLRKPASETPFNATPGGALSEGDTAVPPVERRREGGMIGEG